MQVSHCIVNLTIYILRGDIITGISSKLEYSSGQRVVVLLIKKKMGREIKRKQESHD